MICVGPTLAAVTDSRLLYTAGTLKNKKKQAKTLRGRKDTLALVYFYWGGDRPPRPLGIDATVQGANLAMAPVWSVNGTCLP